jgi:hypothetical protein
MRQHRGGGYARTLNASLRAALPEDAAKAVDDEPDDAEHDRRIRDVEDVPGKIAVVEVHKIHNGAITDTIDQIAQRPAQNEA